MQLFFDTSDIFVLFAHTFYRDKAFATKVNAIDIFQQHVKFVNNSVIRILKSIPFSCIIYMFEKLV